MQPSAGVNKEKQSHTTPAMSGSCRTKAELERSRGQEHPFLSHTRSEVAVMATSPLFFVLLFVVAMPLRGSEGSWCVCRSDATDTALQKTLDYACGHGADCGAVLPSGPCYNPASVRAHCSYAANSYYQQNSGAKGATCDFGGTASLTDTDPSSGTCKYPASASQAGTSSNTTTPSTSTPSSPGSTSNPATPSTGGSFTTPVSAFGPSPSTVSAATATAIGGRHAVFLAVASVLTFLVR